MKLVNKFVINTQIKSKMVDILKLIFGIRFSKYLFDQDWKFNFSFKEIDMMKFCS